MQNSQTILTVLTSKFPPADQSTIVIFYEIGINSLLNKQELVLRDVRIIKSKNCPINKVSSYPFQQDKKRKCQVFLHPNSVEGTAL